MVVITHILEIPKEEFREFLDQIIVPELARLKISESPIGIHISKKGDHRTLTGYQIIDTKFNSYATLSMQGNLKICVPNKFEFLNAPEYWTKLMEKFEQLKYEGKDH